MFLPTLPEDQLEGNLDVGTPIAQWRIDNGEHALGGDSQA